MDAENVVQFNGVTKLDLPAERILQQALDAGLTDVVIAGRTDDGKEYFASSSKEGGTVLWMLERAKLALLKLPDQED